MRGYACLRGDQVAARSTSSSARSSSSSARARITHPGAWPPAEQGQWRSSRRKSLRRRPWRRQPPVVAPAAGSSTRRSSTRPEAASHAGRPAKARGRRLRQRGRNDPERACLGRVSRGRAAGAAALSRAPAEHGRGAHPRVRRASAAPKLRRCAERAPLDDLLRARRPLAGDRRRTGAARSGRARLRERPRGNDRVRDLYRLSAPAQLDRRAPRRRTERVLVTNGSMQADAFLFEHRAAGDEAIVERPPTTAHCSLRERGAHVHAVELQPDGIDTDALAELLSSGGVRPTLAHIIPNFQNPAGYTPRRRAPAPARAGRRARLPGVRGRPLRGTALGEQDRRRCCR